MQARDQEPGCGLLPLVLALHACFAEIAILVEQRHQGQFRRIFGESSDIDLNDLALWKAFDADSPNVLLQPPDYHFISVRCLNFNASTESLRIKKLKQSRETVAVTVVGRC